MNSTSVNSFNGFACTRMVMQILAGLAAVLILGFGTAPAQTLDVQNGATVWVQNGGTLDLGSATTLAESGGQVTGPGQVKAERTLDAPSGQDVAGLGAVITTGQNLGQTTVIRSHAEQSVDNRKSVQRYYEISPATNSGLDATLEFSYADTELNDLPEDDLTLFRSDDGGATYTAAGYDSREASTNTITLSDIDSFERFSAAAPDLFNYGSLALNGTDQFIDLSSVADDLSGATTLSIEFWVKPDFTNQSDPDGVALFGLNDTDGNDLLHIYAGNNSTQDQKVRVYNGSGSNFEITGPALSNGTWHHIAYTIDSSTGTLYVDGNQIGNHNISISFSADDQWSIGQQYDSGTEADFTAGVIDKVQVWNSALSQSDIQHNSFQPIQGDESGLTAYLPLNNSSDDFSGNDNNASLVNSPPYDTAKHPTGTFISGSEGWRMMTAPTGGKTYNELLDELWIQGIPGSDSPEVGVPNVLKWDEPSQQFVAVDGTNVPEAGQGFIVYVYNDQDYDGTDEGFPKMLRGDTESRTSNVSPSLDYTSGGVADSTGWNLVANPYGSTINWDAPGWDKINIEDNIYIWDSSDNSYISYNGETGTLSDGKIAPWQGFWVKATGSNPSLEITNKVRDAGGVLLKEQDAKPASRLKLTLQTSGERRAATVVHFDDRAKLEKDPLDTWQLDPLSTEYLSLYTTNPQDKAFDINAIPTDAKALNGKVLEIPVHIEDSESGGKYTFRWDAQALPEGWGITLKDTYTGKIVGLQQNEQYKFEISGNQTEEKNAREKLSGKSRALTIPSIQTAKISNKKESQMKNRRFVLQINPNGKSQQQASIPDQLQLNDNYPNPFNPTTVIRYGVPEQSDVQLNVYNVLGQKVRTLISEQQSAGQYEVSFDGNELASGMYIYQLKVGTEVLTKKMMLIK